jgi:large subunit ribosomal protein L6
VELRADGRTFSVKGKLGELSCEIPVGITYEVSEGTVSFARPSERPQDRAYHGLARALVNNLVVGVTEGFKRILELEGTGYKWEVRGDKVYMTLGYSHPVEVALPKGVSAEIKGSQCTVSGSDKQMVGFIASKIRRSRKVEPYKGKGIRYQGEYARRKAGKQA